MEDGRIRMEDEDEEREMEELSIKEEEKRFSRAEKNLERFQEKKF